MSEHPNAELLRRGYAAFNTGDIPTLSTLFDDDVTWSLAGRNPLSGTYKGKHEVFNSFFAQTAERSGGTFAVTIETLVADDDHGIVVSRHHANRAGRILATRDVDVFRIRDGIVVEVNSTSFDPYETDAFWSD